MEKEKSLKKVYIFAFFIVLVLFTLSYVFYFSGKNKTVTNNQTTNVSNANNQNEWQTYNSEILEFSIQYPSDWQIEEAPHFTNGVVDKIGGLLVYKQNEGASKRFQLSIFKEDNPRELSSQAWAQDLISKSEDIRIREIGQVDIGGYTGYGITGVFAGDGINEELFLANAQSMYTFVYPVKEENENYLNPIENYEIVKKIIATFILL